MITFAHQLQTQITCVMDIVSRLKQYLEVNSISVTQFADSCGIPRPSASQLLNGRNKKVSDEVISKIHLCYPSLDMMWLLFGEGNIDLDSNIKTSEPQIEENTDNPLAHSSDNQTNQIEFTFSAPDSFHDADKNSAVTPDPISQKPENTPYYKTSEISDGNTIPMTFSTNAGKRVMSIVVYYDDNSFESFIPDPSRKNPFIR